MYYDTRSLIFLATASAISLGVLSAPVSAFVVTQDQESLLTELLGETPGLSGFSLTTVGDERAFGVFSDAPFDGLESGVVLSTGQVVDLPGENTGDNNFVSASPPDLSTDFGPTSADGDSIALEITFDVNDTAERLFFDYAFGSEEFLEFAGSNFNDSFELRLNGTNLAFLSNGDLVNVNNLASSPSGPFSPDYINNPAGPGTETKLDGFTTTLSFEGVVGALITTTSQ